MHMTYRLAAALAAMGAAAAAAAQPLPSPAQCQARSGPVAPTVVELYTSEGCSSCPPADQWLRTLKGKPGVLALAFHVNYWDRLGWTDRFASTESTARQWELARQAGRSQVYTPQVLVGGRDWRSWPQLPQLPSAAGMSPVAVTLTRDGDTVSAEISAASSGSSASSATPAPARLAGYWAVLEDQHQTRVRAGENAGATLQHDHVVRRYQPVPVWPAATASRAQLSVSRGDPAFPRRVVFVVTDPASARPLQAAVLGC